MRGKGKNRGGRPSVITNNVLRKLEEAFLIGASDKEACLYAGIGKSSLYEYCKENPQFSERKEVLKDNLVYRSRQSIAKAIEVGNVEVAKWYLSRKRKDEFAIRYEATGKSGEAIQYEEVNPKNMSKEEKMLFLHKVLNN